MKEHYLEGRVAIVTGANSGMGMATTAALSDLGKCEEYMIKFIP